MSEDTDPSTPFVPVSGTPALFCVWDTRVKEYAAYARANNVDDGWTAQQWANGDSHFLWSSIRNHHPPGHRGIYDGFWCVLGMSAR
jgi:hypothetical protein